MADCVWRPISLLQSDKRRSGVPIAPSQSFQDQANLAQNEAAGLT